VFLGGNLILSNEEVIKMIKNIVGLGFLVMFFWKVDCMYVEWQRLAIDGSSDHLEGKRLSDFHSHASDRGFVWHMPETQEAMIGVVRRANDKEWLVYFWRNIQIIICIELGCRCVDGDKYFIDKYLARLDRFLYITGMHEYEEVVKPLFEGLLKTGNSSLCESLWNNIYGWDCKAIDGKDGLSRESMHLLYTVQCLDVLFKKYHVYEKEKRSKTLLQCYYEMCLNSTYTESPEYKAMYAEVERMLKEGITLETK
jgi:hypothetical protein